MRNIVDAAGGYSHSKSLPRAIEKKCCSCTGCNYLFTATMADSFKNQKPAHAQRMRRAHDRIANDTLIQINFIRFFMHILPFLFALFAFYKYVLFKHTFAMPTPQHCHPPNTATTCRVQIHTHTSASFARNCSPKCICVAESSVLFDLKIQFLLHSKCATAAVAATLD